MKLMTLAPFFFALLRTVSSLQCYNCLWDPNYAYVYQPLFNSHLISSLKSTTSCQNPTVGSVSTVGCSSFCISQFIYVNSSNTEAAGHIVFRTCADKVILGSLVSPASGTCGGSIKNLIPAGFPLDSSTFATGKGIICNSGDRCNSITEADITTQVQKCNPCGRNPCSTGACISLDGYSARCGCSYNQITSDVTCSGKLMSTTSPPPTTTPPPTTSRATTTSNSAFSTSLHSGASQSPSASSLSTASTRAGSTGQTGGTTKGGSSSNPSQPSNPTGTTKSSTATTPAKTTSKPTKLKKAEIAGIVVGGVIGLILLVLLLVFIFMRCRDGTNKDSYDVEMRSKQKF